LQETQNLKPFTFSVGCLMLLTGSTPEPFQSAAAEHLYGGSCFVRVHTHACLLPPVSLACAVAGLLNSSLLL